MNILRELSQVMKTPVEQLESVNDRIRDMDALIVEERSISINATLISTIPGIGPCGALRMAAEIDDVDRFPSEDNIFAYAGIVPRMHQSGGRGWKGHMKRRVSAVKT